MTGTTDRAPWCPRCGNARDKLWAFCPGCHFNTEWREGLGWRAAGPWEPAIRAELARQALEMWTSGSNDISYDVAQRYVLTAYNWLGAHPLRLPGEGA